MCDLQIDDSKLQCLYALLDEGLWRGVLAVLRVCCTPLDCTDSDSEDDDDKDCGDVLLPPSFGNTATPCGVDMDGLHGRVLQCLGINCSKKDACARQTVLRVLFPSMSDVVQQLDRFAATALPTATEELLSAMWRTMDTVRHHIDGNGHILRFLLPEDNAFVTRDSAGKTMRRLLVLLSSNTVERLTARFAVVCVTWAEPYESELVLGALLSRHPDLDVNEPVTAAGVTGPVLQHVLCKAAQTMHVSLLGLHCVTTSLMRMSAQPVDSAVAYTAPLDGFALRASVALLDQGWDVWIGDMRTVAAAGLRLGHADADALVAKYGADDSRVHSIVSYFGDATWKRRKGTVQTLFLATQTEAKVLPLVSAQRPRLDDDDCPHARALRIVLRDWDSRRADPVCDTKPRMLSNELASKVVSFL